MKPRWKPRLALILAVWALLAAFAGTAAAKTATVTAHALNVRAAPGKTARVLATLKQGSRVVVIAEKGKWLEIRAKGIHGYIYNQPAYVRVDAAKTTKTVGADKIRRQSHSIDRKIQKKQKALSKIKVRETNIISDLDRLDRKINRIGKRIRSVRTQLKKLNRAMGRENTRLAELARQIGAEEAYAASRMRAFYKLQRLGKVEVLASAESFYTLLLRKRALQKILRRDWEVIEKLAADKALQQQLINEQQKRREEKRNLEKTYGRQLTALSGEQRQRRQLLAEIRSRKSLELAAFRQLRQSAKELDRKLKDFQREKRPAVISVQKSPAAPSSAHKGLLNIPVKGKVIGRFGPYRDPRLHFESYRNGIDIRADRGAPIRSVAVGVVLFSQWFKGYGNVIIIDHGNHFYSIYAHVDDFFKQTGDRVDRGEVIATVGDTGSLKGPMLYFEIRRDGKPVNPLKWVKTG